MAFHSIKEGFGDKKKVFFLDLLLYFLFLAIALRIAFSPTDYSNVSAQNQIWRFAIILSIPAGLTGFFTSFFSNQRKSGLLVVGCAGIIIAFLLAIFFGDYVIREFTRTSNITFGLFGILASLFIIPTVMLSMVLAAISSYLGYLIRQIVGNRDIKLEYFGLDQE